jgi:small-conductance mechanosensitive channel
MEVGDLLNFVQREPWVALAIVALVAVVAAAVAHRVLRAVLHRLFRNRTLPRSVLAAGERPAAAVWPLAVLELVWVLAPDDLRFIGGVRHANSVLLIIALTWLAIAAIRGIADGVVELNPVTVEDNLHARRIRTQTEVLARSAMVLLLIGGAAMALLTFPGARQLGASLLASAGVLGIVGGMAARPVFSNLIAGLQIALAQPIRIDDVLIVKGEWGRVEEITGTYVVLKIWDERRLVIPLQWFIENPFENWTRSNSQILGTVFLYVDYAMPLEPLRREARRLIESAPEWDGRVFAVQATDASERALQVRVLMSSGDAGKAFDLRCKVREGLYAFIAREHPQGLPRRKVMLEAELAAQGSPAPA